MRTKCISTAPICWPPDALTQRPGRVDLAVEVPLPDLAARVALLRLYSPDGAFSDQTIEAAAERLDGTTASLAKELVRRSVLLATLEGSDLGDGYLERSLERLLGDSEELSRVLLGARRGDADLPITMDDLVGGEDEWDDDLDD